LYAVAPVETIMTWLPILGRGRIALQAVEGLNLSLAAFTDGTNDDVADTRPSSLFTHLELAGVMHSYLAEEEGDEGFVLGPIDLALRPGEAVFVIGGNGSGKTTLAKLLVGLYAPSFGVVRLNGEPIGDSGRARYRELFSAVFADSYLFEGISGKADAASDARARRLLRRLELNHKVWIESGRFSTTDLSQGQRKRLVLLSAYLEDRPVYVFDEWACDQDPHFRRVFYKRLLPELRRRGKAVLIISHDDRYFHVADRVIKLDYGRLEAVMPIHRRPKRTAIRGLGATSCVNGEAEP
jgi:putative ATP-binding cassette transporter